jgi:RHS repeat-associated protein
VDEIVASQAGGQWAYHHYDARGHCILLTNASGGLLEQYDYDAFGWPYFYNASGVAQTSSGWGNRFLFTGREWLKEVGVYDFRNRHYLPELGRFIQPDPKHFAAGDYNLYRYCHNDPVNKTDPLGLIPLDTIWDLGNVAYDIYTGSWDDLKYDLLATAIPYVPAGLSKAPKAANFLKGVVYKVAGKNTPSTKPYIGRTTNPAGPSGRGKKDGRDRTDAEGVDSYSNTQEGRIKEQKAIDENGGVEKLDNKRNEISEAKRESLGLPAKRENPPEEVAPRDPREKLH